MAIKLSPRYGVNPTIPVCFWCGEDKNEVALLGRIGNEKKGEDFEAQMHMVLDYEPCDKCRENMEKGFTIMEATNQPNPSTSIPMQKDVYPTGRYAVLKKEAAMRIFTPQTDLSKGRAFADSTLFTQLISNG